MPVDKPSAAEIAEWESRLAEFGLSEEQLGLSHGKTPQRERKERKSRCSTCGLVIAKGEVCSACGSDPSATLCCTGCGMAIEAESPDRLCSACELGYMRGLKQSRPKRKPEDEE